jgi:hypothetical protein
VAKVSRRYTGQERALTLPLFVCKVTIGNEYHRRDQYDKNEAVRKSAMIGARRRLDQVSE